MATVTISFNFSRNLETDTDENEFDVDTDIISCIEEYAEEWCNDRNEEDEEAEDLWIFDGYDVLDFETDYTEQRGPHDFDNLKEWAEYCEAADNAESSYSDGGNAYCLRYNDTGDNDMEEYVGFYDSFEEFAEENFDDFEECSDRLRPYIDFEAYARDLSYDYTTYDSGGNVYVFHN